MNEVDRAHLLELGRELSGALQSPWEPRTISRAFATRAENQVSFTMQHWIDLSAARSPLLLGQAPNTPDDLATAYRIFGLGLDLEGAGGEDAALIVKAMLEEIREGFAAVLPMVQEGAVEDSEGDGFGAFAPLLACLITQCGMSRAEALKTRVVAAYVLMASHRRNQNWKVAGKKYAFRDIEETSQTKEASHV